MATDLYVELCRVLSYASPSFAFPAALVSLSCLLLPLLVKPLRCCFLNVHFHLFSIIFSSLASLMTMELLRICLLPLSLSHSCDEFVILFRHRLVAL